MGTTRAVLSSGTPKPLVLLTSAAHPGGCGTALGSGCYTLLMTGSGMARFSEGNLTKEKMTQKLDQLLLPQRWLQPDQRCRQCVGGSRTLPVGLSCRPRSHGHLQACPGRPVQVSQPLLMGRSWKGSCPQMRLALSKEGRESGAGLQCSTACFIAAGTYVALASLVPSCPPSTQVGDAQRCRTCLWSFFPREKPNAEAVFQVFVFVLSVPR